MRLGDFRYFLALLFLQPLVAQESSTSSPRVAQYRTVAFRHDPALRDVEPVYPRPSWGLPPGAQELELQPTTSTPYDRYFGSVRSVMNTLDPDRATMAKAAHLMKVGKSFQYMTRDPYRPDPPQLTEAQHAGDCKSKALWLFENLGDPNALFVIGKAQKTSRSSHAWVYWRSGGRWWILDCTDRADLIAADSISSNRYVPYYSFGKFGTYRHQATRIGLIGRPSSVGELAKPVTLVARQNPRSVPSK